MRTSFFLVFLCGLIASSEMSAHAQKSTTDQKSRRSFYEEEIALRKRKIEIPIIEKSKLGEQAKFDVHYYSLALDIDPDTKSYTGTVKVKATGTLDNVIEIYLDMYHKLRANSVTGDAASFRVEGDLLIVSLTEPVNFGDEFNLAINFDSDTSQEIDLVNNGTPTGENWNFYFGTHGTAKMPLIWTFSQQEFGRRWWPSKDVLSDKADSMDIIVTVPEELTVVSNGVLVSTEQNGTKKTFHWHEKYPISTYLVSLAISDYRREVEFFEHEGGSMPVEFYATPERYDDFYDRIYSETVQALEVFTDLFGPYPFLDEKYAQVEALKGGGMEHQTASSIQSGGLTVMVHELAHQWWGDMITPNHWEDLWLNEGFATYSEALYQEATRGKDEYLAEIMANDEEFDDPVVSSNGGLVVYFKGAWVLHMLRGIVGDEKFFEILKMYGTSDNLKYGNSSSVEFVEVCEAVYGSDLNWFFDQWLHQVGRPYYEYTWSTELFGDSTKVNVTIQQMQSGPVFGMPLEIFVHDNSGSEVFAVDNNGRLQTYTLVAKNTPTDVTIDDDMKVLKNVQFVDIITSVAEDPANLPFDFRLSQNYPNPFNPETNISFQLNQRSEVVLSIYTVRGQHVKTLYTGTLPSGNHLVRWDGTNGAGMSVGSGVYFYRLQAGNKQVSRKMLLIR